MVILANIRVFSEGHKNWRNLHRSFDTCYIMSNRRWRFHQFLWPSYKLYGLNSAFQSTNEILQDSWEGSEKKIHPPENLNPAHHLCSRVYVKNWLILRWKIKAPIAPGCVSYKQQKNIEKCMHENAKSSRGVANLSILHSITMCWNAF